MKLFRRPPDRPASRGQSMVEFALILPLLALLLVMAIDFGRVFFGWIALQNAARIGADWAAQTAEAWPDAGDPGSVQDRADYQTFISNDLTAANCEYPSPLPLPTFEDADTPPNGAVDDWGDLATVELDCEFELITPLAEGILGGPVELKATATFMVHGSTVGAIPEAPPPPCEAPVADIDTDPATSAGGRVNITNADLEVDFTDLTPQTSSCPIEVRTWDFDDGSPDGSADEVTHAFPPHVGGGNTEYDVVLTVQTDEGTDTDTIKVRVTQ